MVSGIWWHEAARRRGPGAAVFHPRGSDAMADHENRQPQLVGIYEHGLDGKGRMVLPAKIRARIGETGMIGMLDGCLGLWSLDRFDDVADRILAKAESGEASMAFYRRFIAFAAEVTPEDRKSTRLNSSH